MTVHFGLIKVPVGLIKVRMDLIKLPVRKTFFIFCLERLEAGRSQAH